MPRMGAVNERSAYQRCLTRGARLTWLRAEETMSLVGDRVEYRFSPEEARAAARDFDLKRLAPDFIDDPFPYYRALREHDPVHRMPDGAYLITRWRDCDAVYRDARVFSSDKKIEFKPKYGDAPRYPDGAVEPRDRRDGGGARRAGRSAH